MWVRCDVCRRYAPLSIGGLQDVDYRSKTFSCSQCGSEAYLAVIEPTKEAGMQDYRLDEEIRSATLPPSIASQLNRQAGALTSQAASCRGARLTLAVSHSTA